MSLEWSLLIDVITTAFSLNQESINKTNIQVVVKNIFLNLTSQLHVHTTSGKVYSGS